NWNPLKYLHLAIKLKKEGWEVSFIVSPQERKEWLHVLNQGFLLPKFTNLQEIAEYLYESAFLIGNDSGIGHLASNLKIPTLTISGNPKRVRLWRPDFFLGNIVTISFPLPNFKGIHFRFREKYWHHFISVSQICKAFHQLVKKYESSSCQC
ncbi:MAG: glycosyltransferase family 9 protein, partial [Candidatus Hodarchaeota archaeon]